MIRMDLVHGEEIMEVLKTFRHEFKYRISYDEMLRLKSKLDDVLDVDRSSSGYLVRSLYFDSVNDDDYYDKLGGEIKRKKIRLRIYEVNSNFVKLEIKNKYDIHQLKKSLVIDKKTAKKLINGEYDSLLDYEDEVAYEIYNIMQCDVYKPKVIIEYTRIAYVGGTTTRITFDYDIKCSNDVDSFFDDDINYYDISDKKDVILEVKFDRFLEPYLSNILSSYINRFESVSKYVMGRNV